MVETPRIPARLWRIYRGINPAALTWAQEDAADPLGLASREGRTQLAWGTYSRDGLEHALHAYRTLERLAQRVGSPLGLRLDLSDPFVPRLRIETLESRVPVVEVLIRQITGNRVGLAARLEQTPLLYVEWLLLQNPGRSFDWQRPPLPRQDRPGLALSAEILQVLLLLAKRVGAEGIALRPDSFHSAWAMSRYFHFLDGAAQARFEALRQEPRLRPLWLLSWAFELGCVRFDGERVTWTPDLMFAPLEQRLARAIDTPQRRAALRSKSKGRYAFDLPALRRLFPWERMPPPPVPQRIEELLRPTPSPASAP
jgi:hypothetical protein